MEEKDNQDLVVGSDGAMNDGSEKVEVKITPSAGSAEEPASTEAPQAPVDAVQTPPAMPAEEVTDQTPVDAESTQDSSEVEVKQPPADVPEENAENSTETAAGDTSPDLAAADSGASANSEAATETPGIGSTVASELPTDYSANQQKPAQKPHEHRNNKKLAVIMTLLVALILAGGAVYLFMSAESNTAEAPKSTNTEPVAETEEITPATAEDVDQATQAADDAMNGLEDDSDFSEESLNDSNLGLE